MYTAVRRNLDQTPGWNDMQNFINSVLQSHCKGQTLPQWTPSWEVNRSTHGSFSRQFNRKAITVALQQLLGSINNDPEYFEGIKSGNPS